MKGTTTTIIVNPKMTIGAAIATMIMCTVAAQMQSACKARLVTLTQYVHCCIACLALCLLAHKEVHA